MKKVISYLVFVALLGLAGMAQAGERAGAFSVSPFVGGYVYDDGQGQPGTPNPLINTGEQPLRENRVMYGIRLGYDWTDSLATEAVFHYVWAQLRNYDSELDAYTYRLDMLYNFAPQSRIVPYVAVGGGGETISYWSHHVTDAIVNGGAGVKFFMTDDVALRLDGRYIWDFHEHPDYHNLEYSLGLSWVFGGKERAVTAMETTETPAETGTAAGAVQPPEEVPSTEAAPGHYKYCVTLHIEFDIDRAVIRPEYRDEIAKVGDFMKKYPTTTAVIEGHTDNVGTYNHNMELSQRRAEAVVNYLVDNFGIDRSRLTAKGYGFTRPIADNSTNAGKQKNRRIEAIIDCAFDVQKITPPERLCMTLVVDFDSGSAVVKPMYRSEIAKVADYMKEYPTTTAIIEGHTDNVGNPEANMKLSQRRAEAVVNYLVDQFGIDRSRLTAKGYGSTRRISYNNTPQGRAKNRRIDAIIDCVIKK